MVPRRSGCSELGVSVPLWALCSAGAAGQVSETVQGTYAGSGGEGVGEAAWQRIGRRELCPRACAAPVSSLQGRRVRAVGGASPTQDGPPESRETCPHQPLLSSTQGDQTHGTRVCRLRSTLGPARSARHAWPSVRAHCRLRGRRRPSRGHPSQHPSFPFAAPARQTQTRPWTAAWGSARRHGGRSGWRLSGGGGSRALPGDAISGTAWLPGGCGQPRSPRRPRHPRHRHPGGPSGAVPGMPRSREPRLHRKCHGVRCFDHEEGRE